MFKCYICGKQIKSGCAFSKHINYKHNVKPLDYYNKYIKKENEGKCKYCNNSSKFLSISKGYQKYCSRKCAQSGENNNFKTNNPQKNVLSRMKTKLTCINKYGCSSTLQNKIIKEKAINTLMSKYGVANSFQIEHIKNKAIKNSHSLHACLKREKSKRLKINQIALNNNLIYVQDIFDMLQSSYWFKHKIVSIIKINNWLFVHNKDLKNIIFYETSININNYNYSRTEKIIINSIKTIYTDVILENTKSIISPLELDIYIPKLNLAIEYNGTYFHSDLMNVDKFYHLNKSLKCRELNIRLIHIYEFENLTEQIKLLLDLINGKDNYNKKDFNKNNLLKTIPEPEIIYKNNRLVVHGAGKLY